jgi:Fic family protein
VTVYGPMLRGKDYLVFMPRQEIGSALAHAQQMCSAHADEHPVVLAYFIYLFFTAFCHPFEDGNGRTGRLLANVVLFRAGFPMPLVHGSRHLNLKEFCNLIIRAVKATKRCL